MLGAHETVPSNPLTLDFDNELADHVAADRLYYKSTFWSKCDKVVATILLLFGIACVSLVGFRWWTLIWFPLSLAEWFNWLSPRRLRVWLFFRRNPKFLETYHLIVSDNGIHFRTRSIDSSIAWTHYNRILEDESVILLIYGGWMYTVIPKRVFEDVAQLSAFRSLVGQHIPGSHATARLTIVSGGRSDPLETAVRPGGYTQCSRYQVRRQVCESDYSHSPS